MEVKMMMSKKKMAGEFAAARKKSAENWNKAT